MFFIFSVLSPHFEGFFVKVSSSILQIWDDSTRMWAVKGEGWTPSNVRSSCWGNMLHPQKRTNGWKLNMKLLLEDDALFPRGCFLYFFSYLLIFFASKKTFRILIFTNIPLRNGKFRSTHCTLLQPCSTMRTFIFLIEGEEVNMVRPQVSKCQGTHKQKYKQRLFMLRLFSHMVRKFLETSWSLDLIF